MDRWANWNGIILFVKTVNNHSWIRIRHRIRIKMKHGIRIGIKSLTSVTLFDTAQVEIFSTFFYFETHSASCGTLDNTCLTCHAQAVKPHPSCQLTVYPGPLGQPPRMPPGSPGESCLRPCAAAQRTSCPCWPECRTCNWKNIKNSLAVAQL